MAGERAATSKEHEYAGSRRQVPMGDASAVADAAAQVALTVDRRHAAGVPPSLRPSLVAGLQRAAGNQAVRHFLAAQRTLASDVIGTASTPLVLQRLTDDQKGSIKSQADGIQKDYAALESQYPIAAQIEALAEKYKEKKGNQAALDPGNVKAVLGMVLAMYHNADALERIITSLPQTDREDGVGELIRVLDTQPWATRNIVRKERYKWLSMDNMAGYARAVWDVAAGLWGTQQEAERVQMVEKLFSHSKGYDTSFDDASALQLQALTGGGAQLIVKEWLKTESNTDVFTALHTPTSRTIKEQTVGYKLSKEEQEDRAKRVKTLGPKADYWSQGYQEADATRKKAYWTSLIAALVAKGKVVWSEPAAMQQYLDENIDGIKAALSGLASAAEAEQYLGDIVDLVS